MGRKKNKNRQSRPEPAKETKEIRHETQVDKNDAWKESVLVELERRRRLVESAVQETAAAPPLPRLTFYPFAYALSDDFLDRACWYCLQFAHTLVSLGFRRCRKCSVALYCTQECETLGHKDHNAECAGFERNKSNPMPSVEVRLLGRIANRYLKIKNGEDKTIKDFYLDRQSKRLIMEIWAHEQNFAESSDYTQQFQDIYHKLINFYQKSDLPSKLDVFKLHCRDFVNRHAISDAHYLNEIGKGLYLDLCEYDHSCRPDTVFFSDGFKSTLVGLKPGRDISDPRTSFYSYIDLLGTFDQRQKQLKDTWFFDCKCNRCRDPKDHILTSINCQLCGNNERETVIIVQGSEAPRKDGRLYCATCDFVQEPFHVMESNYTMRDIGLFLDDLGSIAEDKISKHFELYKMKANYCLTKFNVYRARLILQYVHYGSASVDEKARLIQSVEPCLRHCFPKNHPGLSFYLRDVSAFCHEAEFYEDSIAYAKEALAQFESVFVRHPVIAEIRQLLPTLQRKAALQKQRGALKRLESGAAEAEADDLPELTEDAAIHSVGSIKERAQHRRSHRAPTPGAPGPVSD